MAEYITHEHDVVIIGAGGAGLRAAIEAPPRARESPSSRNRFWAKPIP